MSGFQIKGDSSQFNLRQLDQFATKLQDGDVIRGKTSLKSKGFFTKDKVESFTLYQKTNDVGSHKVKQREPKRQAARSHIELSLMNEVGKLHSSKRTVCEEAMRMIMNHTLPGPGSEVTGAQLKEVVRLAKLVLERLAKTPDPMPRRDELVPHKDRMIQRALQRFLNVPQGSMVAANSPTRSNNPLKQEFADEVNLLLGEAQVGDEVQSLPDPKTGKTKPHVVEESLSAVVNLVRNFWASEMVMPSHSLASLCLHQDIDQAIGELTYLNGLDKKVVEDNTPGERQQAALRLRDFVQNDLPATDRESLRERVAYMRELASISLDRVGDPNSRPLPNQTDAQRLRVWQKGVCVSGASYMGLGTALPTVVLGIENPKDANVKVNNMVIAMVIHYDTIFGDNNVNVPNQPQPQPQPNPPPQVQDDRTVGEIMQDIQQTHQQQMQEEDQLLQEIVDLNRKN